MEEKNESTQTVPTPGELVHRTGSQSVQEAGGTGAVLTAGGAGSDDDGADSIDEQPDGGEGLSRVSTGPPYSIFSRTTKIWIMVIVSCISFVSPMTATIYFPALNPIAADLGVSLSLINLTITTYMVCQGIAPTLFGDLADVSGRRPAFIIAMTIYVLANIGLALQTNYAALLVLRMVQSSGSSGTIALAFAVVADISVSAERGKYMGFVSAGLNAGPAISPVLGGILTEYLGWRAIFWFCAILSGVATIPYTLFIPETCRKVVGNGSVPPRGWNKTLLDHWRLRKQPKQTETAAPKQRLGFPNPLKALRILVEKDLSQILFLSALIYLVFILMSATLSTQFKPIYGLNDLQIGLCYLPYGCGCCFASVGQGYLLDWNYRRVARKIGFVIDYKRGDDLSKFPIERARAQVVMPILSVGLVATTGYGWALQREVHIAVPLVMSFVIGLTVTGSYSILQTLCVDLNPHAPATAVAALNLIRCLCGAVSVAFIEKMIEHIGRGWTFTFWALLCAAFTPILFILPRWGPGWREERRLRLLKEQEKREEAERAAVGPEAAPES
ncbi:uncharacterized protein E0L32_001709 [Thyridium curvatum]|uniref:Major facilitator superfamily (MFS) profile domain-containing protein n=1 Tax=Thyridium curvatum TaxID=1093900 RepID=A0A507AXK3_9PEZI|nr:uncharacterized protein E0L32_001490 [Thyridium curvatum]XP_030990960.1 uncharacterized protein E0L32_001709 [Thyridium curvatum]TPX09030.1 hypothetical protein E0L32_001490 [Thyridium curvatum]TPX09249.1 hypothetical protein E0L32_001709 [Thyridium curvatum]